jgi:hypothetical protein
MWPSLHSSPSVAGAREASLRCHRLGLLAWLPRFPSWGQRGEAMLLLALTYGLQLTGVGTVSAVRRRPILSYYTDRHGLRPPSCVRYGAPEKGDPLWR